MARLNEFWAGRIYGTNTGNLFVQFSCSDTEVVGTLRVMDTLFGLVIYKAHGHFDGILSLTAEPVQSPQGVEVGRVEIEATLTSEGKLSGSWNSAIGTAGTFELFPHDLAIQSPPQGEMSSAPEQIYTATVQLGAIRLFASDIKSLIRFACKDFLAGRPIVTYSHRGNEVTKYAEDFEDDLSDLEKLNYIKITVQEPEQHGINKVVIVELNSSGQNVIRVQGIHESWVLGKLEALTRYLKQHERSLVTSYKRFGLGLNSIIFLFMLILIPDISSLWNRVIFVSLIVALLGILLWVHTRFIPNTVIYLSPTEPSLFARIWPTILSWVIALSASLAGALAFWWLTRDS